MMDGWDNGLGAGWWLLMSLFWLAVIVVIVWAVTQLLPRRSDGAGGPERPEEILERRLARGEIDVPTYEALREKLGGGAPAGRR